MANFESLPEEIVTCIAQCTPSESLAALAKVSKKLNRCSTPLLYRYVHLWENKELEDGEEIYSRCMTIPSVPDWTQKCLRWSGSDDLERIPRHDKRIFHLASFLRTISENETLRSHVIGASLESRLPSHDEKIGNVIRILSPSLKHLHCTRTLEDHDSRSGDLVNITSLEIEVLERQRERRRQHLIAESDNEKVHSLFRLPNLRILTLVGIRSWNSLVEGSNSENFPFHSNITSLSLKKSLELRKGLKELLGWIEALKIFHYEMTVVGGLGGPCFRGGLSWALQSQQHTLEEMFVYGEMMECPPCNYRQLANLQGFSQLTNVGVPFNLIPRKIIFEGAEGGEFPPISDFLPMALVNLQLELPPGYARESYFSTDPTEERGLNLRLMEFGDTLGEIVVNKKRSYPGLQTIVLWQNAYAVPAEVDELKEEDDGCAALVTLCRRERIKISWVTSQFPPLVGA